MITSKQRSYLKSIAHSMEPVTFIGKDGITENFISQLNDVLEAREIVKIGLQKNSSLETKDAANEVARLTGAEFVQSIGRKFVLYKKSSKKPKIELPS